MSSSVPPRPEVPQRVLDHRQVAQTEEVHLEQPELLDAVHVELRDDPLRVVAGVLRELQREVPHERRVADHDAGGVHRILAAQTLERAGRVDDLLRLRLALVGDRQLRRQLQRLLDRMVAAHHGRGIHLAEPVPHRRREAQDARGVADPLLPLDRLERHDLRDVVGAVLGARVPDHLVAPALVEVHVDVGHLDPLRVQEALEDQSVPERVDVGDAEAVGHDRAGGRPAPRADADALLPREPDQVPDDQEVAGQTHLQDHARSRSRAGPRSPRGADRRSARPRLRGSAPAGTPRASVRPATSKRGRWYRSSGAAASP